MEPIQLAFYIALGLYAIFHCVGLVLVARRLKSFFNLDKVAKECKVDYSIRYKTVMDIEPSDDDVTS